MKREDLKNYIFEQCLSEAKTHPLVMRGAQWVIDQIGGYDGPDAKKLARKMTRGIPTNEPTAEHVYNAAQFHYGEILRKHSPGMDRPEVYANMRTQLRAHLGLDGEVNDGSPRTSKHESAFNFIMGLKRLNELTGVTDKLANKVLRKRRTQYVNKFRDIMNQDRGPGSVSAADGEKERMNRTQKLVNARQARKTGDAEKPVTGEEYREDYPTKSWSRPVRYGFSGPLS